MRLTLSLFFLVMVLLVGCGSDQMSVTTSNDEALKNFVEGRDLIEKLRSTDAAEYLEKAVALDSNFALAYLYLSFTETNTNAAFAHLEKAKSLLDHISQAEKYWILAFDAAANGQSKMYEKYLQDIVDAYPRDARALNYLGNYYFGQQDYKKSIVFYKRATTVNPEFSQAYNQLGYAYRYLENYSAAEEAFKKYIKLIPDDPNPYDSYAELLLKMGEFEVSIETYEKALEIDPDFAPSHRGIASNLVYMREYNKARGQFKRLSKIAQNEEQQSMAHYGCAVTYIAENNIQMVMQEIQKLGEMAKESADTADIIYNKFLKAMTLYEFGELSQAEENLQKARQMIEYIGFSEGVKNNLRRGYFYNMTRLAVKMENLELAKECAADYQKIVEKNENPLQMMYTNTLLGIIAYAENDFETALTEFQQANQQDAFNHYWLAQTYIKKGEKVKAVDELKSVIDYNGLLSFNYIIIRNRAEKQLIELTSS